MSRLGGQPSPADCQLHPPPADRDGSRDATACVHARERPSKGVASTAGADRARLDQDPRSHSPMPLTRVHSCPPARCAQVWCCCLRAELYLAVLNTVKASRGEACLALPRNAAEKPPRCFGAHAPHLRRRHLRALGHVLTNTLPRVLGGSLHLGHLATESLVEFSGRAPRSRQSADTSLASQAGWMSTRSHRPRPVR